MFFDLYEGDLEVMNLPFSSKEEESKVSVNILNPVVLAIKYRSINCLKYLVEKYGLRPSIKKVDIIVRRAQSSGIGAGEYPFTQWLLPICLKIKDLDTLSLLLKHPSFFFTP